MLYRISWVISRVLGTLLWRLRVRDARHVPPRGGVLLACNHQSFLDVLLVGAALQRPVRFLARRTLWDSRVLGLWMDGVGAVPVSRGGASRAELRGVVDLLAGGEVVAVFPEGTRSRDGSIGALRGGLGFFARRSGVPVVPVRIRGAREAWPRERRLPRRGRVRLCFGRPVRYPRSWEDEEVAADVRRRLLDLPDDPVEPRSDAPEEEAACAPLGGEGAA